MSGRSKEEYTSQSLGQELRLGLWMVEDWWLVVPRRPTLAARRWPSLAIFIAVINLIIFGLYSI